MYNALVINLVNLFSNTHLVRSSGAISLQRASSQGGGLEKTPSSSVDCTRDCHLVLTWDGSFPNVFFLKGAPGVRSAVTLTMHSFLDSCHHAPCWPGCYGNALTSPALCMRSTCTEYFGSWPLQGSLLRLHLLSLRLVGRWGLLTAGNVHNLIVTLPLNIW